MFNILYNVYMIGLLFKEYQIKNIILLLRTYYLYSVLLLRSKLVPISSVQTYIHYLGELVVISLRIYLSE